MTVITGGSNPSCPTSSKLPMRYPITLDAAGNVRALGTLTLLVQGIGGASQTYGAFNWKEIR